MKVNYGGKEYFLSFDNWGLHQYGEACGFETLEDTYNTFTEFAQVAEGKSLTIAQSKNLGYLIREVLGGGMEIREVFNLMSEHPGIIADCMKVALDSFPKPHAEGYNEEDVKKKAKELLGTIDSMKLES